MSKQTKIVFNIVALCNCELVSNGISVVGNCWLPYRHTLGSAFAKMPPITLVNEMPVSCWSWLIQVWRGLPGGLRHDPSGCVPWRTCTARWSSLSARVSGLSRRTWPERICHLHAMTDVMSGKPVRKDTSALVTQSVQDMRSMRRWQCMWHACRAWLSLFSNVQVSDPYRSTANMQQC